MSRGTRVRVTLAGATGWAGSALAMGIEDADDLDLVSAVSRSHAGTSVGQALGVDGLDAPCHADASGALVHEPDVFVEYTKPDVAKSNILHALGAGAHVVVGTSGLTVEDYEEIDAAAREAELGVLAVGNFALTAVLLQKFAEMAARHIDHWELIDYGSARKKDAPSGTARELANRLSRVRPSALDVPLDEVEGPAGVRGARLEGTQVHSVRLPGHVLSVEAVFGMPDQRLVIRHDAGSGAEPYVSGALLAIRKVGGLVGLHRGLDRVMGF